jgi:uncharacterized membrane protein YtjA (UPF0391 family)
MGPASVGGYSETVSRTALCRQEASRHPYRKETIMLRYAVIFFVIALIAAVLGFGGIAAGAADIAKLLFVVFLVLAVVSFVVNLVKGR